MLSVVTVGELLVEVMRTEVDVPFTETGAFVGPFPSGAPAIFADAVARLGHEAGIVGGVGDDGFGRCLRDRLDADGVDTTRVQVTDSRSTGVAFVAYFSDGSRRFLFHMADSAAGIVGPGDVTADYIDGADAVHVNGSSLAMGSAMRDACYEAVEVAAERDVPVSVDPNLRLDLLGAERTREILDPVLEEANVVTPTAEELALLTSGRSGTRPPEAAARDVLDLGVELVAIKRGAEGCTLVTRNDVVPHSGFDVEAVDPTGAGDAFSAAVVVGYLEEMDLDALAAFANAAGAHAVTAMGPMEGVAGRAAVESLAASRPFRG